MREHTNTKENCIIIGNLYCDSHKLQIWLCVRVFFCKFRLRSARTEAALSLSLSQSFDGPLFYRLTKLRNPTIHGGTIEYLKKKWNRFNEEKKSKQT